VATFFAENVDGINGVQIGSGGTAFTDFGPVRRMRSRERPRNRKIFEKTAFSPLTVGFDRLLCLPA